MIVTIHQPDFIPYLGFFHRLLTADHLIYLDDVQFIRRGWQHRDKIKTKNGSSWITLQLVKGEYHQKINEVQLSPDNWVSDHLNLIEAAYKKAPFFKIIYPQVEHIYNSHSSNMIDLNLAFISFAMQFLNINIKTSFSSAYSINSTGTQRLLDLVRKVNGTEYLTGTGSREYLQDSLFVSSGIKLIWQNFSHPKYNQLHGEFIPMLSCLDLFFNCGENSANILRGI